MQITFREQWIDKRLKYDDMDGRIRFLTLTEQGRIWKPDLFFSNEKEGKFHDIIMPNVLLRIYPNGDVLYSIRLSLVLACPMDLKYYPLDKQTCFIRMASCKDSHLTLHCYLACLSLFSYLSFIHEIVLCVSTLNTNGMSGTKIIWRKTRFSYKKEEECYCVTYFFSVSCLLRMFYFQKK